MNRSFKIFVPIMTTLGLIMLASSANAQAVRIANYGGSFGDAMNDVCLKPFSAAGKFKAEQVVTDNMLAQLKIQEETGKVTWDLTPGAEGESYIVAMTNGWIEKFDWAAIDPTGILPPLAKPEYGIIASAYSSALGVRTDKLPPGRKMASWADFWNVKDFPGPRSLRNTPIENIEFALIADGVAVSDVYTVLRSSGGVDRAFKKLDEIKPHITHWWTSAQQPVQGLATGELFFATSFAGRIANLKKDKVPVINMWNGASLNTAPLTIPKGAPNKEGAIEYIKFCYLNPDRMLELAKKTGGGSLIDSVVQKLSPEEQEDIPTTSTNLTVQLKFDPAFWFENRTAIQKRWSEWMLK